MAEQQLAELQSQFDSERNINKQVERKNTDLTRECMHVRALPS